MTYGYKKVIGKRTFYFLPTSMDEAMVKRQKDMDEMRI